MKSRKLLFSLILALCLCFALAAPAWALTADVENTSKITDNQVRMIDIENQIIEYLSEYQPDITFGSQEFVEYAVDVLMFDADKNLAQLINYDDVTYYLNEYLYELDKAQISEQYSTDLFFLSDDYKMRTLSDIKDEVCVELQQEEEAYAMRENIMPLYSFNPSAAAAYAQKYAYNYNTTQYASDITGDCTNFVSQAIFAGGISQSKPKNIPEGTMSTTEYWYALRPSTPVSVPRWSTSWINVENFYSWAVYTLGANSRVYSSIAYLQEDAAIGDVVQLHRSGENHYYHSIIITSGTQGNFNYCGHTTNRQDKPLSDISDYNICRLIKF